MLLAIEKGKSDGIVPNISLTAFLSSYSIVSDSVTISLVFALKKKITAENLVLYHVRGSRIGRNTNKRHRFYPIFDVTIKVTNSQQRKVLSYSTVLERFTHT